MRKGIEQLEQLSSFYNGELNPVGAILMVADQPFLPPSHLLALKDAFFNEMSEGNAEPIIVPTVNGQKGNPVAFSRGHWEKLKSLQGNQGARQLFSGLPIVELPIDDVYLFEDIDTPEQYALSIKQARLLQGMDT